MLLDLPRLIITFSLCLLPLSISAQEKYESETDLPEHLDPTLSPPLSPEDALKSFQLVEGFEIELVASEPMIEDPILIDWDMQGRLWVCEMRGFMMDIDATGQFEKVGRISVIEDTNGDGQMDKVTRFLDDLVLPRAMRVFQEGLLVAEHDKLWFVSDPDRDLVPDKKELVNPEYATHGSVEHRPNGLLIGLDNWIYNARSEKRYKRVDGKWIIETTENRGQWGITQDDYGRLYYNFHWSQLHADSAPPNTLNRNPNFAPKLSVNSTVSTDQFVYPIRMNTAINRGYRPGVLDNEGKLIRFASACSPWIYRGDAFPSRFKGDAFVCAPAANTIKRNLIVDKGLIVSGINAYSNRDFLASTDERFRPVSLSGGPDGALYVVDMYRGIIQQADFMTDFLRRESERRKLEKPIHLGRIYRIRTNDPSGTSIPDFYTINTEQLVELLKHPNGWVRDKAQQCLVWKNENLSVEPLKTLAKGKDVKAAIHALWTLEGMGREIFDLCLGLIPSPNPKLSIAARTLAAQYASNAPKPADDDTEIHSTRKLISQLEKQFPENENLSFHTLIALGKLDTFAGETLTKNIVHQYAESPFVREALLGNLALKENEFLNSLAGDPEWATVSPGKQLLFQDVATSTLRSMEPVVVSHLFQLARGSDWQQVAIKEGLLTALLESEKPLNFAKDPDLNDARFLPHIQWPGHEPAAKSILAARELTDDEKESFVEGKSIYNSLCASCHGPNGEGMALLAPPLAKSEWVTGDPNKLAKILLHGLEGPIEVDGKKYAPPEILPAMPPVGMMSDSEIAATLTYIRRAFGHTSDPVTSRDIRIVRDTNASQIGSWTAKELKSGN